MLINNRDAVRKVYVVDRLLHNQQEIMLSPAQVVDEVIYYAEHVDAYPSSG